MPIENVDGNALSKLPQEIRDQVYTEALQGGNDLVVDPEGYFECFRDGLASWRSVSGSPSEPSYGRFVRNVMPYILALGHFFEHYRDGLASYVPDSGPPIYSSISITHTHTYTRVYIYNIHFFPTASLRLAPLPQALDCRILATVP